MRSENPGKRKFDWIRLVGYGVFLGIFYLIPVSSVESGSICLIYHATGFLCPGCGVTRGFANFLHLRFARAYAYNPVFTCSLFPIGLLVILQDIVVILFRRLSMLLRKDSPQKPLRSMIEYLWELMKGR